MSGAGKAAALDPRTTSAVTIEAGTRAPAADMARREGVAPAKRDAPAVGRTGARDPATSNGRERRVCAGYSTRARVHSGPARATPVRLART